jgi:chemotaxis protein CheD
MAARADAIRPRAVFLSPGDFHFHCPLAGRAQPPSLYTLLGSCVCVVWWHPERRIGAMSHVILPGRCKRTESRALDARYADEVMPLLVREMLQAGTRPPQFQVYVVGGSNMYPSAQAGASVGARNIDAVRAGLRHAGFSVRAEHVGSTHHRKVELDLTSGVVTVTFDRVRVVLS